MPDLCRLTQRLKYWEMHYVDVCCHCSRHWAHFNVLRTGSDQPKKGRVQHFQGPCGIAWRANTEVVGGSLITELHKAISATMLWIKETMPFLTGASWPEFCYNWGSFQDLALINKKSIPEMVNIPGIQTDSKSQSFKARADHLFHLLHESTCTFKCTRDEIKQMVVCLVNDRGPELE